MEKWVIQNLSNKSRISGHTGNYVTVVSEKDIKEAGGIEGARRVIARLGGWPEEDIKVKNGDPGVWGDVKAKHVYIAERIRHGRQIPEEF